MPTRDISLIANGRYATYIIKFNGNGNTSGSMSDMYMTYETTNNLNSNTFNRVGYTFNGWNTKSNGSGTSYSDNQSVKNLSTIENDIVTLYAQWTPISYNIRFDGNGNTSGSMSDMTVAYDASQKLSTNNFNKTDYVFSKWNTEPNGSGTSYTNNQSVKNLSSIDGDVITLYAQWELAKVNYQVIHHVKKLDNISYEIYETETKNDLPNSTVYLTNLSKSITGFTYDYGTVDNITVTSTTILENGTRKIDLWYNRNIYRVLINYDHTGILNVTGAGSYYYEQPVTVSAAVKNGYSWNKWLGSYTSIQNPYTFIMGSDDVTLTATYTTNMYVVKFDGNGNTSGSMSDMNDFSVGTELISNNFTRSGYEFIGWNTEPDGSGVFYNNNDVINGIEYEDGSTITLYAVWRSLGLIYLYNDVTGNYEGYQMYIANGDDTWDLHIPYISNGNDEYDLY